jgi:hypothetical protein
MRISIRVQFFFFFLSFVYTRVASMLYIVTRIGVLRKKNNKCAYIIACFPLVLAKTSKTFDLNRHRRDSVPTNLSYST